MEAVVLAGGLGTRLRNVVPDVPKPMAPVGDRPFLERLLEYWAGQGVSRFVLSIGYKGETIRRHFGPAYVGACLAYAEEASPLGTGGGLLEAVSQIEGRGTFLVLNGDTFLDVDLDRMYAFHRSRSAETTMALVRAETGRYESVEMSAEGRLTGFKPRGADGGTGLINGGVYLMEYEIVSGLPWRRGDRVSLEGEIFPMLLRTGRRVFGFSAAGRFVDIGVPADYFGADAILSESGSAV